MVGSKLTDNRLVNLTNQDILKAGFEAGIKLGAALHQFIGTPVNEKNLETIENAIESAIMLQPFVVKADVKINKELMKKKYSKFGYTTLSPEMLKINVVVNVNDVKVKAVMCWKENLKYPLMEVLIDE